MKAMEGLLIFFLKSNFALLPLFWAAFRIEEGLTAAVVGTAAWHAQCPGELVAFASTVTNCRVPCRQWLEVFYSVYSDGDLAAFPLWLAFISLVVGAFSVPLIALTNGPDKDNGVLTK